MKKNLVVLIFLTTILNTFAYSDKEKLAADFLSYKDIIIFQENWDNYQLDNEITRREMSKVTLKLSWKNVINNCENKFEDLKEWDWGCKYAEIWLKNGYFTNNKKFNPDNNISKIEALKMIIKARWITKKETKDWREWYVNSALKAWILENKFTDYDALATRWWIFTIAQRSIEYSWNDEDINLINDLLNI